MEIRLDDLSEPRVKKLLREHLEALQAISPPESMHALGIEALRSPGVTFWSAWEDGELLGCGALKEIDSSHGEVKSMRTASAHLRRGVASGLLLHIIKEARGRSYRRLSLETGSMASFEPARSLYRKFGFKDCRPFADYREDPNSVFMVKELESGG